MTKLDEQMQRIETLLQDILAKTGGAPEADEDPGCPTCGCPDYHEGQPPAKGKTLIVMTKKKGPPGAMPDMLKDIMGTMMGRK